MSQDEPASAFERARQEIVARNRARLVALGLEGAVQDFQTTTAPPRQAKKKPRKRQGPPQRPTRASSRLQGQHAEAPDELGQALVDEQCPRCLKVITRGMKQHLEHCSGIAHKHEWQPGERDDLLPEDDDEEELDEEEDVEEQEARRRVLDQRLRELALEALVDFTPEEATFVVLGSTGNHYRVSLTDAKRTCQCPDHRIRKRDCKHIKLVLKDLGVTKSPKGWRQAVEQRMAQLDGPPAAEAVLSEADLPFSSPAAGASPSAAAVKEEGARESPAEPPGGGTRKAGAGKKKKAPAAQRGKKREGRGAESSGAEEPQGGEDEEGGKGKVLIVRGKRRRLPSTFR